MTIQTIKDIEFPTGVKLRPGMVLNVPDSVGTALIEKGLARLREMPGPTERKSERDVSFNPGDPLPPAEPYVRVPAAPLNIAAYEPGAYEDQDNFVRDLVTFVSPVAPSSWWFGDGTPSDPPPPVTPSGSASGRPPLLDLDTIKIQCHIESDQTADDPLLLGYEMAARLHTENYLQYTIDDPDTVGENIKQACLMLVAHWYRNRESVTTGKTSVGIEMPLGYKELLFPERDFPAY
jgi:Phage gp6-like head-tail connector protein